MKPRFEPDVDQDVRPTPVAVFVNSGAYDANEPAFAASVEEKPTPSKPRFVVDGPGVAPSDSTTGDLAPHTAAGESVVRPESAASVASVQEELLATPNLDSWRRELAARVNNYRARRRPRSPRYPSLQLKFDPEPLWSAPAANPTMEPVAGPLAVSRRDPVSTPTVAETPTIRTGAEVAFLHLNGAEPSARILEFPRSVAPLAVLDELAEPVYDRPRILEVPELLPPPPALGGILMEPVEQPAQERRPGFELPLRPAPMPRRLMAGATDALLVVSAFMVFAYIFFRITAIVPPLPQAVGTSAVLLGIFWMAYQYLLLVHAGTTPGLKLAKLRLSRFDGSAVPRRIRRWRVLASALSGLSLALGYAWCFLDEDELCWHDRITRTYMAPRTPQKVPTPSRHT
jgi:uncharacterized RDD family membrane protein YckC